MFDERTALVVVDMQNDFAHPHGSLFVQGGDEVVSVVNDRVEAATAAGATVVYTQDWHPESTPHFEKDGGIWPVHCVQGTWGAAFHDDLLVADGAEVIRKGTAGEDGYSGFSVRDPENPSDTTPTRLEAHLRERDIERVVVAGLATDYCVKETALDAARLGFETQFLSHAAAAVDLEPGDGDRAIEEMRSAGAEIVGG
jgi:nicotinamidase/pyrazinamidase